MSADQDLRSRTLNALSWSFFESVGVRGAQFVVGIILARLLLPEQFGLIGMLAIFMAVAQVFLEQGFGAALIQKQDATHVDSCSVFYCNIVVALIAAGLLCSAAPWIADFFHEPLLTPLTRFLSLNIVINSLGLIHTTLLIKHIDFKTQAKVSLAATAVSGVIGITLAFRGFGVWSLAIQIMCGTLIRTVLLWTFNSWRPSLIFSLTALRSLFAFGSRILFSGLLNCVFDNLYLLVIGKLFSAGVLGFYTRAKQFQKLPTITLCVLVSRVTFPVFSTIQDDPVRLKRYMRKALTTLVFVNFPAMIGLACVAKPMVLTILTEKWAPCVPYLQLLCGVGIFYPVHVINLDLLKARGRSDLYFRIEALKKVSIVVAIGATWPWGVEAMIGGQIAVSLVCCYLNSYYTGRMIDYPITEQIRDFSPYLAVASVMGATVCCLNAVAFPNQWSVLAAQIAAGIGVYVVLCRVFQLTAFMEVWGMCQKRIPFLSLRDSFNVPG